ncbi:hypothetical protein [Sphingomonas abietis]|uniref:Uncharacterized protein n=1 Tax=Sphingomonas abietis TaxID=3012344 RepID=A0ABY7NWT6_9SPHN|nr:hypothetical protein [Sphingomonas abietis]WBO24374.1 hypothetical protein PBT88_09860 [Sphingomonas abietis]
MLYDESWPERIILELDNSQAAGRQRGSHPRDFPIADGLLLRSCGRRSLGRPQLIHALIARPVRRESHGAIGR